MLKTREQFHVNDDKNHSNRVCKTKRKKMHIPTLEGCSSGFAVTGCPSCQWEKRRKKNFSTNELMSVSIETLIYVWPKAMKVCTVKEQTIHPTEKHAQKHTGLKSGICQTPYKLMSMIVRTTALLLAPTTSVSPTGLFEQSPSWPAETVMWWEVSSA